MKAMRRSSYHAGMTEAELSQVRLTPEQSRLAAQNFGLARDAARRYHARTGQDVDDLLDLFSESLVMAARCWPPDGPHRFSTYAWKWFRKAIGGRQTERTIHIPSHATRREKTRAAALKSLATSRIKHDHSILSELAAPDPEQVLDFDDYPSLRATLDRLSPLRFAAVVELVMGESTLAEFGARHGHSRTWAKTQRDEALRQLRLRMTEGRPEWRRNRANRPPVHRDH